MASVSQAFKRFTSELSKLMPDESILAVGPEAGRHVNTILRKSFSIMDLGAANCRGI